MRTTSLALWATGCLLVGCTPAMPDREAILHGTLRSAATSHPVQGAVDIGAPGDSTRQVVAFTDAAGTYRFALQSPGRYIVYARAIGYEPQQRAVTLPRDREAPLDFELRPVAVPLTH